jgi:hypothetical protein
MPTFIELFCTNCGKQFQREKRQLTSSILHEVKKYFCTRSCGVTWNNRHKEVGIKRSLIERWIEGRIRETFVGLEVHYNRKDTIGSELDIYVPSLKLAIEISGKSHFYPIFGEDVYQKTVANDLVKSKACAAVGVELVVVDISALKSVKDVKMESVVNKVLGILRGKVKL